jgi:energy-coupling factor transporter ATP-binding protein EcfA2
MKLIGIAGKAGSGKDTLANIMEKVLLGHTGYYVGLIAFADAVKETCSALYGIPLDDFYEDKNKVQQPWNLTTRQLMQRFGTDIVHPALGKDHWVRLLEQRLFKGGKYWDEAPYEEDDIIIITDVRFQHEHDWIIANGGHILAINRDVAQDTHVSEQLNIVYMEETTTFIDNNGSLAQLENAVYEFLETFPF